MAALTQTVARFTSLVLAVSEWRRVCTQIQRRFLEFQACVITVSVTTIAALTALTRTSQHVRLLDHFHSSKLFKFSTPLTE